MVLQLIKGLNNAFSDVATYLEQLDPLPSFYQARLILHETRRNHQASREASIEAMAILLTQIPDDTSVNSVGSGRGSSQSFHRGGSHRSNTCRGRRGGKPKGYHNRSSAHPQVGVNGAAPWSSMPQQWLPNQYYPPCPYLIRPSQWLACLGLNLNLLLLRLNRIMLHLNAPLILRLLFIPCLLLL